MFHHLRTDREWEAVFGKLASSDEDKKAAVVEAARERRERLDEALGRLCADPKREFWQ